jgi:hypothetical protein
MIVTAIYAKPLTLQLRPGDGATSFRPEVAPAEVQRLFTAHSYVNFIPPSWTVAALVDLVLVAETAACGGTPEIRRTPNSTRSIALAAARYRQFRFGVSSTVQQREEIG